MFVEVHSVAPFVELSVGAITKEAIEKNATRHRKHACLLRQGRQACIRGPCGWMRAQSVPTMKGRETTMGAVQNISTSFLTTSF
jgi:hypothetical protein